MTHFLASESNQQGFKLEDILSVIRADIIKRCELIVDDTREEAVHVLENNIEILQLLSKAIRLAEDSSFTLDKSFGPGSDSADDPRIGRVG